MPKQDDNLTFTFVTDGVESAIAQASAAAADGGVRVVGGAVVAQQLLHAGLVDELHLDIMPVFLGAGTRFFPSNDLLPIKLERIGALEVGARTSLRFRVRN
ncbi:MAG: dihydrofolate reductase family protein [Actinomycetota bacterium]|nr:dihydrofolate reductase family protein [Actinomycetota bacterium]